MMIADCSYGYAFDTILNGKKVTVTVLITASGKPIVFEDDEKGRIDEQ